MGSMPQLCLSCSLPLRGKQGPAALRPTSLSRSWGEAGAARHRDQAQQLHAVLSLAMYGQQPYRCPQHSGLLTAAPLTRQKADPSVPATSLSRHLVHVAVRLLGRAHQSCSACALQRAQHQRHLVPGSALGLSPCSGGHRQRWGGSCSRSHPCQEEDGQAACDRCV